jgi:hypothetical protein
MFYALRHDVIILAREHLSRLLDRLPAIFGWAVLGVFTGSRLGEYGQSKPRRGEFFAAVPSTRDAGEWAGTPLAFMRSAFLIFDIQRCLMSRRSDSQQLLQLANEVHVRFRYDKSPNNFSIRKFGALQALSSARSKLAFPSFSEPIFCTFPRGSRLACTGVPLLPIISSFAGRT